MKKKAYTFHHTHWDCEWYFTEQAAQVQFVYHMKELFYALDNNLIDHYHLDGKSSSIDQYFEVCKEDKEKFIKYVKENKIIIGPLYEQLSSFIDQGESIIKNLNLGMDIADEFGGTSKVAYIPDSFGQIQDFPKIYNGFDIKSFIFRRGMGDVHHLKNDFIWKCNDGSEILTSVLQAGYSFAGLAFMQGRLIKNAGLNLDKKSIINQMLVCAEQSTQPNEFLFPAGKDNCPVMFNFKDLIKQYNDESDDFEFVETTLFDYMEKLKNSNTDFQTYEGEFYTTQYHRVHKSIFSARADIKILQDKLERLLIFEVQPIMTILHSIGIEYESGMLDKIWKMLICSQTHSEATNSDEVNEQIYTRVLRAYEYAKSIKIYLTRKVAESVTKKENAHPLVVFNTLSKTRELNIILNVFSKNKNFSILRNEEKVKYSVIKQEKVYGGWKRKHKELLDSDRDYFVTKISINLENFEGLSYEALYILEDSNCSLKEISNINKNFIENEMFRVELFNGKINIYDKKNNKTINDAIYFENSGDCGDTFDYDYPDKDYILTSRFENAKVIDSFETDCINEITLSGLVEVCKDLKSRSEKKLDEKLEYSITLRIRKNSNIIEISGKILNTAKNHRLRLVLKSDIKSTYSIAGTQFGYIKRPVVLKENEIWKQDAWLEQPIPVEPLLNHVTLENEENSFSVMTRSTKEYEIIGEDFTDVALTVYRSVGHFGLPDLNRRPGRASGIPEEIMECPLSQMIGKEVEFEYGIKIAKQFDANALQNDYEMFATNQVYFESQEFNRVFTPMKYFEVNKLQEKIPVKYSLLKIEGFKGSVSSVMLSKDKKGYIVRVYNNENEDIEGGEIKTNLKIKNVTEVNLREEFIKESSLCINKLEKGKILTLKLEIL